MCFLLLHFTLSAAMAWYVVHCGKEPGMYSSWDKPHAQVDGFKGACYKKFKSREKAFQAFYGHGEPVKPPQLKPAGHDQLPLLI
jgi:viroplasmin and RNaseH domain-containing protein